MTGSYPGLKLRAAITMKRDTESPYALALFAILTLSSVLIDNMILEFFCKTDIL